MRRGEIWWASLRTPERSEPGGRRPVLVISSDQFNRSGIETVIVAVITRTMSLGDAPGNIVLQRGDSGLDHESVVNVSQVITVNKDRLTEQVRALPSAVMAEVERGLRLVLALA